jgi:mannitol/fructose-specific phosphotransferase system IIA component (Ntr-type)
MTATTLEERVDIMTDKQLDKIIMMILKIAQKCKDKEEIVQEISELLTDNKDKISKKDD